MGPSPRIRGKFTLQDVDIWENGTIPANTGKIHANTLSQRPCPDHPREYGENVHDKKSNLRPLGPSPRIRGKSSSPPCFHVGNGTIPANTGKMIRGSWGFTLLGDHPREYGENMYITNDTFTGVGPSPRIRGKCGVIVRSPRALGTIPANTGKMQPCSAHHHQRWDHPREYGENKTSQGLMKTRTGPSPRIRGK